MRCQIFLEHLTQKLNITTKNRLIAIGGLHAILLFYALIETIKDMIIEEQPVTEHEIIYIVGHLLFHVFLIVTLIGGAIKRNHWLVMPWLISSFPVFAIVSFYTFKYSNISNLLQFTFNIVFLSFFWYLWFTVLQFSKNCKKLPYHHLIPTKSLDC